MSGTPQIISITPTGGLNQANIHQAVPININSSLSQVLRQIGAGAATATPIHVTAMPTVVQSVQSQSNTASSTPLVLQSVSAAEKPNDAASDNNHVEKSN